jgi:hypothetical protein
MTSADLVVACFPQLFVLAFDCCYVVHFLYNRDNITFARFYHEYNHDYLGLVG